MRTAAAWHALQTALETLTPSCAGDARFTDDGRDTRSSELRRVCDSCPVRPQCDAYASSLPRNRIAGFWAGRRRGLRAPDRVRS